MPQTGFALGLDRLVMAAQAEGALTPPDTLDAYVIPIGDAMRGKAIEVLASLRAAGLRADVDLLGRGPTKNLEYANAVGAKHAIIVGEREAKGGSVAVRDMTTGEQREVAVQTLARTLLAG